MFNGMICKIVSPCAVKHSAWLKARQTMQHRCTMAKWSWSIYGIERSYVPIRSPGPGHLFIYPSLFSCRQLVVTLFGIHNNMRNRSNHHLEHPIEPPLGPTQITDWSSIRWFSLAKCLMSLLCCCWLLVGCLFVCSFARAELYLFGMFYMHLSCSHVIYFWLATIISLGRREVALNCFLSQSLRAFFS